MSDYPQPVWTWSIGPGASTVSPNPTRQLTKARGRVLTCRVDGHPFAQFTIDARSDEAAEIVERESDLWVWRDGLLMFRGRVIGAQDQGGPTVHTTTFQAIGYRGMLSVAARIEEAVSFTAVNQGQVPWDLIETWQSLPGGDWGIIEGVGSTGPNVDTDTGITVGSTVGEIIDRLAKRDGGYEWDINPNMELDRWYPQRGADLGEVLEYGANVAGFDRGTAEFGNAAVATGSEQTVPATDDTGTVAADQRGRWTVATGFSTIDVQATLVTKAAWLVAEASTVEFEWAVTLTPGAWGGTAHIGLGDIVELRVRSGRIDVAGDHRVVEIQVTPGEDGTETVRLGLVGVS